MPEFLEGYEFPGKFQFPEGALNARYESLVEARPAERFSGLRPEHLAGMVLPAEYFPQTTAAHEKTISRALAFQIAALTTAVLQFGIGEHLKPALDAFGYSDLMQRPEILNADFGKPDFPVMGRNNSGVVFNGFIGRKLYRQTMLDLDNIRLLDANQIAPELECDFFYSAGGVTEVRSGMAFFQVIHYPGTEDGNIPFMFDDREGLNSVIWTNNLASKEQKVQVRRGGRLNFDAGNFNPLLSGTSDAPLEYTDLTTPLAQNPRRNIDFRNQENWLAGGVDLGAHASRVLAEGEVLMSSPEVVKLKYFSKELPAMDLPVARICNEVIQPQNQTAVAEMIFNEDGTALDRQTFTDTLKGTVLIMKNVNNDWELSYNGQIIPKSRVYGGMNIIRFRNGPYGMLMKIEFDNNVGMIKSVSADVPLN